MPLRVERVEGDHEVAGRAGPGQRAAERGGAQQTEAGQPGGVAQHVQGAAGQVRPGSGGGQRAGCGGGQHQRGAQPQERQPPAGGAFRLAERARGGGGDDHGAAGLEDQRQLACPVRRPVPVQQRDPQPDGAGRHRGQGGRDPAAGKVQVCQPQADPRRPARR
ncbi:hypothetical protein FXF52_18445 [Micromonospora sp. MP36]|nr:hypothetical protein FXF52_18445 [Micromonospora sp. MP36]